MRILISKYLFLVALTLFVSGNSCAQEISIVSGERWFAENKDDLLSLNRLLLGRPEIRRVDSRFPLEILPKYEEFSQETKIEYEKIKKLMMSIGIINADAARIKIESVEKLIQIRYTIRSRGIFNAGGSALSISYAPDPQFVQFLDGPGIRVKPLDIEDWYVVVFHDRPETNT